MSDLWQASFVATAALTFVCASMLRLVVTHGEAVIPVNKMIQLMKFSNACYTLTMVCVKTSIGLFFLKLFSCNYKRQRFVIWVCIAISIVTGIVYFIMTFATCGIMLQSQKTSTTKL